MGCVCPRRMSMVSKYTARRDAHKRAHDMVLFALTSMQEIIPYTLLFITLFFEVFLLVSFLERKATRKRMPAGEGALREFPSVTIAVPCYNEETSVQDTMRSLLALE